jgi:TPR repeat protein
MFQKALLALLVATLAGCVTAPKRGNDYNLGVEAYRAKDYSAARKHWATAVKEKQTSAYNNLGYLLYHGLGGGTDHLQAVSLWFEAAKDGHSEAQWHLGKAFEDGKGTEQSLVEAYAWYRCAVANSQSAPKDDEAEAQIAQDASKALSMLLEKLPIEQLPTSERLAKQYIAKHGKRAGA